MLNRASRLVRSPRLDGDAESDAAALHVAIAREDGHSAVRFIGLGPPRLGWAVRFGQFGSASSVWLVPLGSVRPGSGLARLRGSVRLDQSGSGRSANGSANGSARRTARLGLPWLGSTVPLGGLARTRPIPSSVVRTHREGPGLRVTNEGGTNDGLWMIERVGRLGHAGGGLVDHAADEGSRAVTGQLQSASRVRPGCWTTSTCARGSLRNLPCGPATRRTGLSAWRYPQAQG